MAGRTIACPHCKEEVGKFVVEGNIETLYDLSRGEYTVGLSEKEKYLCSKCYEDISSEVVFREDVDEDDEDVDENVDESVDENDVAEEEEEEVIKDGK
ncbi:MAG: hypothetical protein DDT22_01303 [candidate division WS2 bacterium]|nr:hypothetical protein [Candidatus Lithacetigena glycinireducens]